MRHWRVKNREAIPRPRQFSAALIGREDTCPFPCGGMVKRYLGWAMKSKPKPSRNHESKLHARMEAAIDVKIRHYQRCRKLFRYVDRELYNAGRDFFQSDTALAEWLCEPARALGYKIPLRVIRTATGRRQVLQIIAAIEYGVYL